MSSLERINSPEPESVNRNSPGLIDSPELINSPELTDSQESGDLFSLIAIAAITWLIVVAVG